MPSERAGGEKKGKGKAVQIADPPASGRVERQRRRQAAVDTAKEGESEEPRMPTRPILKRPKTKEAGKKAEEQRKEEEARKGMEKSAAMKTWEEGVLS